MNPKQTELSEVRLPRWNELFDFDLYMDQLVPLLNKILEPLQFTSTPLTKTMINNYVKHGIVEAPIKKRYTRMHAAYLIVVCILKQVYSMDEISDLIKIQVRAYPIEQAYDYFCQGLESCLKQVLLHQQSDHDNASHERFEVQLVEAVLKSVSYTLSVQAALSDHKLKPVKPKS